MAIVPGKRVIIDKGKIAIVPGRVLLSINRYIY